ncbi:MAG: pantetheine-phosphate adenylyltransferase [Armatimonadota bacterium]
MVKAVCPGSFDPVTSGHIDVIERAAMVFEEVIVAVAPNPAKKHLFSLEERIEMLRESTSHLRNIRVDYFDGLLVDYVRQQDAGVIVKGLRALSDFEFEFQMALVNRNLTPEVETVFMMTGAEYSYVSSSIVREIAGFGGSVKGLVPETVEYKLKEKFRKLQEV